MARSYTTGFESPTVRPEGNTWVTSVARVAFVVEADSISIDKRLRGVVASAVAMRRKWREFLIFLPLATTVLACSQPAVDRRKADNRLELAKDFLRRQQLQAAAQEAERALEHDPDSHQAHNILGLVNVLEGFNNQRLLEVDNCLTGVEAEALRHERQEQLMSAEKAFARAVQLAPSFGEGWANRGGVALDLGDFATAKRHLERALGLPHTLLNIGTTRANLGWALFHQGEMAKAAKELLQAAQLNPGLCVAKYRLGRVYFAKQEWNKAVEEFRAVTDNAACPMQEAHLYLLKSLEAVGAADELSTVREACIKLAPKSCTAAHCKAQTVAAEDGGRAP